MNTSKGVIRYQDLGPCTDDEILDNLKSEGVLHVRNIQVRRNGVHICSDIQYTSVTKEN